MADWNLAQLANATPEVRLTLMDPDTASAFSPLEKTTAGQRFLEEMREILAICGHREMHLDILYPTWGEDPSPVLDYARAYLDADPSQIQSDVASLRSCQ